MADRVFLHVGTMKSATSYLQHLCQLNEKRLLDAGVWWPGNMRNKYATEDIVDAAHSEIRNEGAGRALVEEIRQFEGDVLVSNELIFSRSTTKLNRLLDAIEANEIHVIITARDVARVVPSQWQSHMRNRSTITWADYVTCVSRGPDDESAEAQMFWQRQDLVAGITRWATLVPLDRITVVTVPPAGSDPSLTGDRFLSVLGREFGPLKQPSYRNQSLGAHSAELLRRVNHDTMDWSWLSHRRAFKSTLSNKVLEARGGHEPKLGLTADELQRMRRHAELMISELGSMDVRVIGDLADLLPQSVPSTAAVDPGASTADELLAAAQDGLIGLAREYADLKLKDEARGSRRGQSAEESAQIIASLTDRLATAEKRRGPRRQRRLAVRLANRVPGLRSAVQKARTIASRS